MNKNFTYSSNSHLPVHLRHLLPDHLRHLLPNPIHHLHLQVLNSHVLLKSFCLFHIDYHLIVSVNVKMNSTPSGKKKLIKIKIFNRRVLTATGAVGIEKQSQWRHFIRQVAISGAHHRQQGLNLDGQLDQRSLSRQAISAVSIQGPQMRRGF